MAKPKIKTENLMNEMRTGSSFFKNYENNHSEYAIPERQEVENQGTKEPRNQGRKEERNISIKEDVKDSWFESSFTPSLEEREATRTVPVNVEVFPDQEEAMRKLIFIAGFKGKRKLTRKQIVIEALDDYLKKEFKKLQS